MVCSPRIGPLGCNHLWPSNLFHPPTLYHRHFLVAPSERYRAVRLVHSHSILTTVFSSMIHPKCPQPLLLISLTKQLNSRAPSHPPPSPSRSSPFASLPLLTPFLHFILHFHIHPPPCLAPSPIHPSLPPPLTIPLPVEPPFDSSFLSLHLPANFAIPRNCTLCVHNLPPLAAPAFAVPQHPRHRPVGAGPDRGMPRLVDLGAVACAPQKNLLVSVGISAMCCGSRRVSAHLCICIYYRRSSSGRNLATIDGTRRNRAPRNRREFCDALPNPDRRIDLLLIIVFHF